MIANDPDDGLIPIAWAQSSLTAPATAPKPAHEGAPQAWLSFDPVRPNPIGMHEVGILEIDGARVRVAALEAIDGTPVVDVEPVLRPS